MSVSGYARAISVLTGTFFSVRLPSGRKTGGAVLPGPTPPVFRLIDTTSNVGPACARTLAIEASVSVAATAMRIAVPSAVLLRVSDRLVISIAAQEHNTRETRRRYRE